MPVRKICLFQDDHLKAKTQNHAAHMIESLKVNTFKIRGKKVLVNGQQK